MSRLITPAHERRQAALAGTCALREFDLFATESWTCGRACAPGLD
jgi:hypothetical protein